MGFDIDQMCNHNYSQYNYSHDNKGGFHLICGPSGKDGRSTGNIIRYNISQNDRNTVFVFAGAVDSTWIYNNTIYIGEGLNTNPYGVWDSDGGVAINTFVHNNIFYNLGQGKYVYENRSTALFDYNCFFGKHPENEPEDLHKITDDPRLAEPGSGGTGRGSVDGYKLKSGSPCLSKGKFILKNGGRDYWGNSVSEVKPPEYWCL